MSANTQKSGDATPSAAATQTKGVTTTPVKMEVVKTTPAPVVDDKVQNRLKALSALNLVNANRIIRILNGRQTHIVK